MVRINLLPKELIKREEVKRIGILLGLGIGLVVCIFMGAYLLKMFTYKRYMSRINKVDRRLSELQAVVGEVERLERSKQMLDKKMDVIRNLVRNRLMYPHLMEELTELLPVRVWLTSVSTTRSMGDVVSMGIDGVSFDNYAIADLITNLESSKTFSKVELTSINAITVESNKVLSFKIICEYNHAMRT